MARIVLAPDKFKGSITARDVAAQVGAGITAVLPDAELVVVPVSDGGDGLLDVALSVGFEREPSRESPNLLHVTLDLALSRKSRR